MEGTSQTAVAGRDASPRSGSRGVSGWGRGSGTRRRRFLVVVVLESSAVMVSIDPALVPWNLA